MLLLSAAWREAQPSLRGASRLPLVQPKLCYSVCPRPEGLCPQPGLNLGGFPLLVAGFGECHQCPWRPEQEGRARALPRLQAHPPAAGFPRGQQVRGSQVGAELGLRAAGAVPLPMGLRGLWSYGAAVSGLQWLRGEGEMPSSRHSMTLQCRDIISLRCN